MKHQLAAALCLSVACVPLQKNNDSSDPQAVKRIEQNGELVIIAQKPDDMRIISASSSVVPFRTEKGVRGRITIVRNGEYFFITVREALADGFDAWLKDKSMRDVFLIPKINGLPDRMIATAKSEGWNIEKIVSTLGNHATIGELKIYCPTRIEFRKKDGTKHLSEFPERPGCAGDINVFFGGISYD